MQKSVFVRNRFGERLDTVLHIPPGDTSFPSVLLIPGIGADLHETNNSHDEIAASLVSRGFAAIQFSFAGRGKSEGTYEDMTIISQANQIDDMLAWVEKQPFVNPGRIGVYAMSFGVPSFVYSEHLQVKTVCFASGGYHPYETIQELFRANGVMNEHGISERRFSSGEQVRVKPQFWEALKQFDENARYQAFRIPVHIIHGTADKKIPYTYAENIFGEIGSQNKSLYLVPDGDHGIIDVPANVRKAFLEDVTCWFHDTI